jgi:hypothetical protein
VESTTGHKFLHKIVPCETHKVPAKVSCDHCWHEKFLLILNFHVIPLKYTFKDVTWYGMCGHVIWNLQGYHNVTSRSYCIDNTLNCHVDKYVKVLCVYFKDITWQCYHMINSFITWYFVMLSLSRGIHVKRGSCLMDDEEGLRDLRRCWTARRLV